MSPDERFLDNPPHCPQCKRPPWRKTHRALLMFPGVGVDGSFTVCMYCSRIYKLNRKGADHREWVEPTDVERKEVEPHLGPVARRFAANRIIADLTGLELGTF